MLLERCNPISGSNREFVDPRSEMNSFMLFSSSKWQKNCLSFGKKKRYTNRK
jgi:hypothetical protein